MPSPSSTPQPDDSIVIAPKHGAIMSSSAAHDKEAGMSLTEQKADVVSSWSLNGDSPMSKTPGKSGEIYANKPSRMEVLGWYLYGLCSQSIQTVLIPVIFSLIISQIVTDKLDVPPGGWERTRKGLPCNLKEMTLYEGLTQKVIKINNIRLSALDWVTASWVVGLLLAAPLLGSLSLHMDGASSYMIAGAATLLGAVSCFPAGFIKKDWIFPPYIAAIVAAHSVATACHTRHLALMVRGFTGSKLLTTQFHTRRTISSWLSLYGSAAGGFGAAMIAAFTYYMLSKAEKFVSLWVVSIFSGIKWLAGILHIIISMLGSSPQAPTTTSDLSSFDHVLNITKHPHALGTLVATFLSGFTIMSIFAGGILYMVGELCIRSHTLLYFWLIYFLFPMFALPLLHPLQQLIRANAVKMNVLGLTVSLVTSGVGFYFKGDGIWRTKDILLFAAVQGLSAGILNAFTRVLIMDCAPSGVEGAFAGWHSWVMGAGMCIGFAVGSSANGLGSCLGSAFLAGLAGVAVLIFGNVSDVGGALTAGHVREDEHDYDGDGEYKHHEKEQHGVSNEKHVSV